MEIVKVKTKISLTDTLLAMPIGVEQVFPKQTFEALAIRKKVSQLKKKGCDFIVYTPKEVADTYVTRLK